MRVLPLLLAFTLTACTGTARRPSAPLPRPWWGESGPVAARATALETARQSGLGRAPGIWLPAGPTNVGGRVTALAVDPADPARIWVGTAAGGVFLTEDEGSTFRPVFDGQTALSIGSLAAHPSDPQVLYVGTGEDNGAGYVYDGEGVFKTTDGGASWTALGLAETRRIGRLAVDPTDGNRIFAAAGGDWYATGPHRGVYRTLDGGLTWQKVLYVAEDTGAIDVVVDPSDPRRVWAATWQRSCAGGGWIVGGPRSGIWRSIDGGDHWIDLTAGLPAGARGRIGLAVSPSDPRVLYANVMGPDGLLLGIYRSLDRGDTWEKRNNNASTDWFGTNGWNLGTITVDPSDPQTVYVLDVRLLRSTNGGRSMTPAATSVHWDWHALVIEPGGRWIAGTDGGLDISQDGGSSWTHARGLAITQLYDVAIDALDPARRLAGAQDNGTLRTLTGSSADWQEVLGNDGLQCEIDPTNSSRVYASWQAGNLYRSTDGGDSFTAARDGIDGSEPVNWSAPLALDPRVPTTLYTGTVRVYRSVDAMVSWTPISPDLRGLLRQPSVPPATLGGRSHGLVSVRGTITVVAPSPVSEGLVWAGTDDGRVWRTADGGASWAEVTPPGPAFWVSAIAPDPLVADRAWLAVTGYRSGNRRPSVRVTEDRGLTWRDVSGNLPAVPVNDLDLDPDWRGRLFAATDLGVFVSDSGGDAWSAVGGGMPAVIVLDLARDRAGGRLFAATHGRSIWTYDLAQLGPADGDQDGVDNNADCAPFDPGVFAPPAEVLGLRLGREPAATRLDWEGGAAGAGPGTVYDVARGDLASPGTSVGLACGVQGTSVFDSWEPPPGSGAFYLVRGSNACGIGTWGGDSAGTPRTSSACP